VLWLVPPLWEWLVQESESLNSNQAPPLNEKGVDDPLFKIASGRRLAVTRLK